MYAVFILNVLSLCFINMFYHSDLEFRTCTLKQIITDNKSIFYVNFVKLEGVKYGRKKPEFC